MKKDQVQKRKHNRRFPVTTGLFIHTGLIGQQNTRGITNKGHDRKLNLQINQKVTERKQRITEGTTKRNNEMNQNTGCKTETWHYKKTQETTGSKYSKMDTKNKACNLLE